MCYCPAHAACPGSAADLKSKGSRSPTSPVSSAPRRRAGRSCRPRHGWLMERVRPGDAVGGVRSDVAMAAPVPRVQPPAWDVRTTC